ncbi:class I SAM-dependent DNA methyltransferase [Desulfogranum mediterraneum]|uniref:class I SAM-dependent DNA methyltransferase n=1 Tax=Desulfogranum mediterraneum TaxID=160661 RepID=UPI0004202752|nr:class I SAM-dependent methyltransferase [Desulfogranum mediterraneum]
MKQNLKAITHMYDTVAREWAVQFAAEHQHKAKDREVLLRFSEDLQGRQPVWDLGCGPGATTAYLKKLGVEASGLDLSAKILEQARNAHPGILFQQGDMLKLGFSDATIAGIVAFYAIVHFREQQVETAFQEIFRVLEAKGVFLCSFHIGEGSIHLDEFLGKKVDIEVIFFPVAFIHRCLKDIGFRQIEIIEREPYPGVEYQSRRAYVFATKPSR